MSSSLLLQLCPARLDRILRMVCEMGGTTIWMHHIDSNETHGEKVSLGTIPENKPGVIRPLTSHLISHPIKTS